MFLRGKPLLPRKTSTFLYLERKISFLHALSRKTRVRAIGVEFPGALRGAVGRCGRCGEAWGELWGAVRCCGELWGAVGSCGELRELRGAVRGELWEWELWGAVGSCGELWGAVGSCGQVCIETPTQWTIQLEAHNTQPQ